MERGKKSVKVEKFEGVQTRSMLKIRLAEAKNNELGGKKECAKLGLSSGKMVEKKGTQNNLGKLREKAPFQLFDEDASSKVFRNHVIMDLLAKLADFDAVKSLRQLNTFCKPIATKQLLKRSTIVVDAGKMGIRKLKRFTSEIEKLDGINALKIPLDTFIEFKSERKLGWVEAQLFPKILSKSWGTLDINLISTEAQGARFADFIGKLLEANQECLRYLKLKEIQYGKRQSSPLLNFPRAFPNLEELDLEFWWVNYSFDFNLRFKGEVEYLKMFPKLKTLRIKFSCHNSYTLMVMDPKNVIANLFPEQVFLGLESLEVDWGAFSFYFMHRAHCTLLMESFKNMFPNAAIRMF